MSRNTEQDPRPAARDSKPRDRLELERRYGSIGISAVAAAARYHSDDRGPAPGTAAGKPGRRSEDSAA